MKFFLLINVKMPTIVGILIFIAGKIFMLSSAVQEGGLLCWYLFIYKQTKISFSAELSMKKSFITPGHEYH